MKNTHLSATLSCKKHWIHSDRIPIEIGHSIKSWPISIECILENKCWKVLDKDSKCVFAKLELYGKRSIFDRLFGHSVSIGVSEFSGEVVAIRQSWSGISFKTFDGIDDLIPYTCEKYHNQLIGVNFFRHPQKGVLISGATLAHVEAALFLALTLWEGVLFSE